MAVTFVIGNSFALPTSIFDPSNSIASALANGFNEAAGLQKSALIELGLILFLITTAVLAASVCFSSAFPARRAAHHDAISRN